MLVLPQLCEVGEQVRRDGLRRGKVAEVEVEAFLLCFAEHQLQEGVGATPEFLEERWDIDPADGRCPDLGDAALL